MASIRDIRMLTRYTAWANERLFECLSGLAASVLDAPRPGRKKGITGILGHAYVVDRIWKGHLEGVAHGFTSRNLEEPMPVGALRSAQGALDQWFIAYVDSQPEHALAQEIEFQFVDGGSGTMSRGDILLHVVNHKTYHRGYVADMLYESGSRPPTMDLPVFLRDSPPPL